MRPIIIVEWDDAHGNDAMFNDVDVDHRPLRFTTVGFLIKSDDIGVSLAMDFGDGKYRDHRFIPRAMIVTERPIKTLGLRRKKRPELV